MFTTTIVCGKSYLYNDQNKYTYARLTMPHTYAQFDSSLSLAMIEEALLNPAIKSVLTEIAKRLKIEILSELQVK